MAVDEFNVGPGPGHDRDRDNGSGSGSGSGGGEDEEGTVQLGAGGRNGGNWRRAVVSSESEEYEEEEEEEEEEYEEEEEEEYEEEEEEEYEEEEDTDTSSSSDESDEVYGRPSRKRPGPAKGGRGRAPTAARPKKSRGPSGIVSDSDLSSDEEEEEEEGGPVRRPAAVWTGEIAFPSQGLEARDVEREVESIADWCEEKGEVLVKWRGRSHLHATWLRLDDARLAEGPGARKLASFMGRVAEEREEGEEGESGTLEELRHNLALHYRGVERVVAGRGPWWLVKWRQLGYSACTWEREEAVRGAEGGADAVDAFLGRQYGRAHVGGGGAQGFRRLREAPAYLRPGGVELRGYQLDGVNWLLHSWTRGVNVMLADEMGLGKTVQAVAFLAVLQAEYRGAGPALVVVPLSTVAGWQREFARWAPALDVVVYVGDARDRASIRHYELGARLPHVLLTTFELALRDRAALGAVRWRQLVVDEGHRLKNARSQLYEALHALVPRGARLLLTGTPLQNALGELWCLLRFLAPDKFTDHAAFEARYMGVGVGVGGDGVGGDGVGGDVGSVGSVGPAAHTDHTDQDHTDPVHTDQDYTDPVHTVPTTTTTHTTTTTPTTTPTQRRLEELHALLKPHILRRLKRDVEEALPRKTERILRVELTAQQKELYRHVLARSHVALRRAQAARGAPASATGSLLNILGQLQKLCNHPALLLGGALGTGFAQESGKLALLEALLGRLHAGGHRVLLFSQSVRMLDVLEALVRDAGYGHVRLDGGTPAAQRQQAVAAFNAPGSPVFVFLLSTRAGGLGLNLQTADTVVIYDSDWNPQNDLQAMARAHRIGQTRAVRVFRLVSAGTVEEQLLERAKRKCVLGHLVIERGRTGAALADLHAVLQFGARALFSGDAPALPAAAIDLDAVLAGDEGDEGDADEGDDDAGEQELQAQFRIADLSVLPSWDDIIPEAAQRAAAGGEDVVAEASEKDLALQEALLVAAGPRRRAVAVSASKALKTSKAPETPKTSKTSTAKTPTAKTPTPKTAKTSMTSTARTPTAKTPTPMTATMPCLFPDATEDTEAEAAFHALAERGDARGLDAADVLARLAALPADTAAFCVTRGGRVVGVNAQVLGVRIRGLVRLRALLPEHVDPPALLAFRLPVLEGVRAPSAWTAFSGGYSFRQDALLMAVVAQHGHGCWAAVRAALGDVDAAWLRVQPAQLARRADCLLRALAAGSADETGKSRDKGNSRDKNRDRDKGNSRDSRRDNSRDNRREKVTDSHPHPHTQPSPHTDTQPSSHATPALDERQLIERYRRPFKPVRALLLALEELKATSGHDAAHVAAQLNSILGQLGDFIAADKTLAGDPDCWAFVASFWPFQEHSSGPQLLQLYRKTVALRPACQ